MLAKNLTAARQLSQQFQNRTIGKTYLALVRGGEKSFQARSGEIRDPIETDGGHVSISQSCDAKFAATDWELVASSVGILHPCATSYQLIHVVSPKHPCRYSNSRSTPG